jgi:chromate transporter
MPDATAPTTPEDAPRGSLGEVFRAFLALGCVAVGGPSAHIAILEAELVERRRWLTHRAFTELFSVGSMLPGPTSTQVVMGCGVVRGGPWGGLVALLAWMAPGVAIMTALALALGWWMDRGHGLSALRGVQPAAIGLIIVAAWRLGRKTARDPLTLAMLALGAVVTIAGQHPSVESAIGAPNLAYRFPLVIALAGLITALARRDAPEVGDDRLHAPMPKGAGVACLALFAILLVGLPLAVRTSAGAPVEPTALGVVETQYRAGALIFGGGQVLLPLIYDEYVVTFGWLTDAEFWTGFGVVQGVPGPLFAMSSFLGGAALNGAGGATDGGWTMTLAGAALGAIGLFLPGALLIHGVLPFWARLRQIAWVRRALPGVNASAVGLIVGAFWIMARPLWGDAAAIAIMVASAIAVLTGRVPPIVAVIAGGVLGWLASLAGWM